MADIHADTITAIPSEVGLVFLFYSLSLGAIITYVLSRLQTELPYTVVVFAFGSIIAVIFQNISGDDILNQSIDLWDTFEPHLILFIFLPALLFGESMSLNFHHVREAFIPALLLAGPGAIFGTFAIGACAKWFLPYDWPWSLCCVFGAILCATDPVAVVALLKKAGASTRLTYLIIGEALLNDGSALVLYNMLYSTLKLHPTAEEALTTGNIIVYFLRVIILSPLVGCAFGLLSVGLLSLANRRMEVGDSIIQLAVTLSCAYLSFFIGEHVLGVSGVITCCTAGVVLAHYAPPLILHQETMHSVWSTFEWLGNTLIFSLAGLLIGSRSHHVEWRDIGCIILIYLLMLLVRGLMMLMCHPVLLCCGYRFTMNEYLFATWGGLRGALAVAIALSLSKSVEQGETILTPKDAHRLFVVVGGTAALTLIVNATLSNRVLKYLNLVERGGAEERSVMFHYVKKRIYKKTSQLLEEEAGDEEHKVHVSLNPSSSLVDPLAALSTHADEDTAGDNNNDGGGSDSSWSYRCSRDLVMKYCSILREFTEDNMMHEINSPSPVRGKGGSRHKFKFNGNVTPTKSGQVRTRERSMTVLVGNVRRRSVTPSKPPSLVSTPTRNRSAAPSVGDNGSRKSNMSRNSSRGTLASVAEDSTAARNINNNRSNDKNNNSDTHDEEETLNGGRGGGETERSRQRAFHDQLMRRGAHSPVIDTPPPPHHIFEHISTSDEGENPDDDDDLLYEDGRRQSSTYVPLKGREEYEERLGSNHSSLDELSAADIHARPGRDEKRTLSAHHKQEQEQQEEEYRHYHHMQHNHHQHHHEQAREHQHYSSCGSPIWDEEGLNNSGHGETHTIPGLRAVHPDLILQVRRAFLEVVRVNYWKQIDSGRLPRRSAATLALLSSIDVAREDLLHRLEDWSVILKRNKDVFHDRLPQPDDSSADGGSITGKSTTGTHAPPPDSLYTFIKHVLHDYATSKKVYMLTSFIEAHEYAQTAIPYYLGESEGIDTPEEDLVVSESQELVREAKMRLADIDASEIRLQLSKQTARWILCVQQDMIEEFHREGILSQKDVSLLLEEVQTDLNRLGLAEWYRLFASRLSLILQNWLWGENIQWYEDVYASDGHRKQHAKSGDGTKGHGHSKNAGGNNFDISAAGDCKV